MAVVQLDFWVVQLYSKDFCAVTVEDSDRPEKLLQLPPPPPVEFIELYRQPPLPNRAEKLLQLPPSNSSNFIDNPPLPNRAEKLLQLPPVEFIELYRQPASSKSGWKTTPTTPPPPKFIELYRQPSLPNRVEKLLQLPPLEFTELYRLSPLPNMSSVEFVHLEKILRITSVF